MKRSFQAIDNTVRAREHFSQALGSEPGDINCAGTTQMSTTDRTVLRLGAFTSIFIAGLGACLSGVWLGEIAEKQQDEANYQQYQQTRLQYEIATSAKSVTRPDQRSTNRSSSSLGFVFYGLGLLTIGIGVFIQCNLWLRQGSPSPVIQPNQPPVQSQSTAIRSPPR